MKKLFSLVLLLCAVTSQTFAQSNPGFTTGQVPTASQWNSYFSSKLDYNLLGTPINVGGTGAVTAAAARSNLGLGDAALTTQSNTFTAAQTFAQTINLTAIGNSNTPGSIFKNDVSFPYPSTGTGDRPHYWSLNLTNPSGTSTGVEESFFTQVLLNGPGTMNGEINIVHPYFENAANSIIGSSGFGEGFEASGLNYGTINGSWTSLLGIFNNASTGTANLLQGIKLQLTNNNTTPGSVANYIAIDYEAPGGSGSLPTSDILIRNADPNASIVSLGGVALGQLGAPGAGNLLYINGTDTSDSTFPFIIKDHSANNLFFVTDGGSVAAPKGVLKLGNAGSDLAKIYFSNLTSGSIQLEPPASGALGSAILTLPDLTGTLTVNDQATLNATGSAPYKILGTPVLNLFSNQTSPIVSPEGANSPNSTGIYIPLPYVEGYATTATSGTAATYNNMLTANLTVTGTATNHWGLEEHSVNQLGTGNLNAELNVQKNYYTNATTAILNFGEDFETGIDNYGTIQTWSGIASGMANGSTGVISNRITFAKAGLSQYNTASNSVGLYVGFNCQPMNGPGSAPTFNYCIMNEDPAGAIANWGHYVARPDTNVPTLNANCGTSPALSATSSDDAGQLTVGTGSPTTCSIVFHLNYGNIASAIVVASDGGSAPTYTYNGGGINFTSIRASGVYQYWVIGAS